MTSVMDDVNSTNLKSKPELSEIQHFYKDSTVFLTGATGFMGRLILEKLIRTCYDLKRIYILIREKKGKTTEERFKELFNDQIFSVMKKEQPNYLEKVAAVIGDCSLQNLGIGEQHQEILKNEVNIVIHSAATVRFDEHLRKAVSINILCLQDLLKLSQKIRYLKAFVHISTAYSNCAGRKSVDEIFYKPPITGDNLSKIVNSLDDDYITKITPALLREWPNTYAMTKAIAEGEIVTYGEGLPVGIVRPSMIIATYNEPVPGWINNIYGPTGVVAATGVGLMRVMKADPKAVADIVPGDFVSNAVIAAAWDIHEQWAAYDNSNTIDQSHDKTPDQCFVPPIFNLVSSSSNSLTWGEFSYFNKKYGYQYPSTKLIWPIMLRLTGRKYEYIILSFLLHTIPGVLIDTLAKLTGNEPKLLKSYQKLNKFIDVISYFSLKSWTFYDNNTRALSGRLSKSDQNLFQFDISKLNWVDYFEKHVLGVRKYILHDEDDSLLEGKKHAQRLYMIYYSMIAVFAAIFLLILYGLFILFI